MTGAVLQYELSGANRDIVNSKGQRIEFYFTDQPNQNPDIKSTEFTFPYLPNEILPVADDVDTVGAIEYGSDQLATDSDVTSLSNEDFNKQFIGIENQTASSGMIMSDANNNTNVSTLTNESFTNYLQTVENAPLLTGNNKKFRHKSQEGGKDTVGFGHLLTEEEDKNNKVYQYDLSEINASTSPERVLEISNDILRQDIEKAEKILITTYGNKFINLDLRRKQMLIDMQFNVREFEKPHIFKKFKKALLAGDEEGMKAEYIRYFKDKKGTWQKLARNKIFKEYFLNK